MKYFFYLCFVMFSLGVNGQTAHISACFSVTHPCLNSMSACDTLDVTIEDMGEWSFHSGMYSDTTSTGAIDTITFITPDTAFGGYPGDLIFYDVSMYSKIFVYEDNIFNHNIINIITIIPCGTTNIQNNNIVKTNYIVYPNPVNRILNVECKDEIQELKITNALGEEIKIQKPINKSNIDVSDLVDGIYFLAIKTPFNIYTQKIIVQN